MSREIKFRLWDNVRSSMSKPFGLHMIMRFSPMDDLIPLQYTGLKDRNGVEIYEGDIVKLTSPGHQDIVGTVQWDYLNAAFLVDGRCGIYGPEQNVEVIGNVFGKSEL